MYIQGEVMDLILGKIFEKEFFYINNFYEIKFYRKVKEAFVL